MTGRQVIPRKKRPPLDRLMALLERPTGSDCWLWTGYVAAGGYGEFHLAGRTRKAHRVAYELLVGPVPEGLDLDHLCRVRRCVNPEHLEPVTRQENLRRSPDVGKWSRRAAS